MAAGRQKPSRKAPGKPAAARKRTANTRGGGRRSTGRKAPAGGKTKGLLGTIRKVLTVTVLGAAAGGALLLYVLFFYGTDLPDFRQLVDYEPPTASRVHASDGRLVATFAKEERAFVPIEAIPKPLIDAFLAAEDKNFYTHPGVDLSGVIRAILTNFVRVLDDRRPVGASTITQQVAKNFLLTNELSLERKVKEAILAFRIERALTKDRILELYLNEIYLGYGSYGVAAAALNYFNKAIDQLTIEEAAYLAALPKAPNNYHPIRRREAAVARRNWVIDRMKEEGFIDAPAAAAAQARPLVVAEREATARVTAAYFVEQVRREIADRYGENALYEGGLSVRTSLDPRLQKIADDTLRAGLVAYDRRHGWRGPVHRLDPGGNWHKALSAAPAPKGRGPWLKAVVLSTSPGAAQIGVEDGREGVIPLAELRWARRHLPDQKLGGGVRGVSDVLAPGDVVLVAPVTKSPDGATYGPRTFGLRQVPDVGGAIVALDPHTGRVLALRGGFSFEQSEFNRATQARRQTGSAFKPFVYLTALEQGLTPTTLILDAPFVIDQGPGLGKWKPDNYTNTFYGLTPMRVGVEKSRNLMTVRLAQRIGMDKVKERAEAIGVVKKLDPVLSMALGAGEATLLDLAAAYSVFVNSGKRITPTLIDRVQDRHGATLFRRDARPCDGCAAEPGVSMDVSPEFLPIVPDMRPQVADPVASYQVNSMLQGVVLRGTGRRIADLNRPLGGKTGTTNESFDTWFVGFSPDLVVGVFVGFDTPRTLGEQETGSSVAAPIFKAFMERALANQPVIPFRIPAGVRLVRVEAETGRLAGPRAPGVILEAFRAGTEPSGDPVTIGDDRAVDPPDGFANMRAGEDDAGDEWGGDGARGVVRGTGAVRGDGSAGSRAVPAQGIGGLY